MGGSGRPKILSCKITLSRTRSPPAVSPNRRHAAHKSRPSTSEVAVEVVDEDFSKVVAVEVVDDVARVPSGRAEVDAPPSTSAVK